MSNVAYVTALLVLGLAFFPMLATLEFWLTARLLKAAWPTSRRAIHTLLLMVLMSAVNGIAFVLWPDWAWALVSGCLLVATALWFRVSTGFTWSRTASALFLFALLNAVIALGLAWFVFRPTIFEALVLLTGNMAPTLEAGDRVLADRIAGFQRWDIVTFRSPEDRNVTVVSRLVGLPGETIELRNGQVLRNGGVLPRPASIRALDYEKGLGFGPRNAVLGWPVTLRADECFVLGDNPENSMDSRFFRSVDGRTPGAVPVADLIALVRFRYRPRERMGFVR